MKIGRTFLSLAFFLLLIALIGSPALAQKPKVGEPAPEIVLEKVVSPPSAPIPTLAGLRGKVVFLEFWGVWCGHCVENIPHLNQLADKFGVRGIEFLSVSNDREKVVREFLKDHPMAGTIAIDSSVINGYGVGAYPTTFLIGRDGKILAETHPALIDENTLEDALADRPLRLKTEKAESSAKPAPKPLFEVWVRPAESDRMVGSRGPNRIFGQGLAARTCLAWAYGVPENRIVLETALPDEKYDIKADATSPEMNPLPALQLALAEVLGVAASREERGIDCCVLALLPGQNHKLQTPGPEADNAGYDRDHISCTNSTLGFLRAFLDGRAGIPVIDETNLTGKYTFDLKAPGTDFEGLRRAVREQLGLDLRKETRRMPVLVIRKK